MPILPIDKPIFPDVPNVIGVPALRRQLTGKQFKTLLLSRALQSIVLKKISRPNVWGLYNAAGIAIVADSVFSVDFKAESKVTEVPLQRGGFAQYNKVMMPEQEIIRLVKTGSDESRNAFLRAIDEAQKSTDLYHVVTPERIYLDANIEAYDYRRTSSEGVSMLIVDIRLKQIRQVSPLFAVYQLPAAKSPTAAPQVTQGVVQPKIVSESYISKIGKAVDKAISGAFN